MYCSPFDEALACDGPPAIFLPDPEGALRFDARWTRDAWGRTEGPHARQPVWLLLRDRGTGFVTLAFATSPTLIVDHPRLQVRSFATEDAARTERAKLGALPIAAETW